jgi:hypothetical protein
VKLRLAQSGGTIYDFVQERCWKQDLSEKELIFARAQFGKDLI